MGALVKLVSFEIDKDLYRDIAEICYRITLKSGKFYSMAEFFRETAREKLEGIEEQQRPLGKQIKQIYDDLNKRKFPNKIHKLDDDIISALKLSKRARNCLSRVGIIRVSQLVNMSTNELHKIPGMGSKSLNDIIKELHKRDLTLRESYNIKEIQTGIKEMMESARLKKENFYQQQVEDLKKDPNFEDMVLEIIREKKVISTEDIVAVLKNRFNVQVHQTILYKYLEFLRVSTPKKLVHYKIDVNMWKIPSWRKNC